MKRNMKKCTITKEDRSDLFYKVDNEGFGYYMIDYGPDLEMISRLGFNIKDLEKLVSFMDEVESAIMEYDRMFRDEE